MTFALRTIRFVVKPDQESFQSGPNIILID